MRAFPGVVIASLALAAAGGCAGVAPARYVYQDGEFGVVGIPENTDRWPTHYRRQAEALMDRHFPDGHEIVRAEEVVEGSRTLTVQDSGAAELAPKLPAPLGSVGKLGHTGSRSQSDTLKIKECRIIYRRARRPAPPEGYAELASLTPTLYIDPNAAERRRAADPHADAPEPGPKGKPEAKGPGS